MFYFSDGCAEQYENHKNFINLCHHQPGLHMDAEWIFFATSHGKSPCDGVGGFVKRYVGKRSLKRPLHDQILGYQSILDLSVREVPSITFLSVSQEEMVNIRADLEDRFAKSKTMPGTRSSHHFVPISCNKIANKLTSEDREFLQFDFDKSLTEKIDTKSIKFFSYVSCIYNTFWWVGIVTKMNVREGDLKIEFLHPHGPSKTSAGHLLLINVLSQRQTFYALSQLKQESLYECVGSQTLTLNKIWKLMKTIKCSCVYKKL